MAKKIFPKIGNEIKAPTSAPVAKVTTPVRNTAIPRPSTPMASPKQVTHEMIAKRAYEIAMSGSGSDETSNWLRAERELKGL